MSTIDTILDKLKSDQAALIEKALALVEQARKDIKAIPPTTTFSDNFSETYRLTDGQISPNGKWKVKYLSGGIIEARSGVMHMAPKAATAPNQTSAPELLSVSSFKNFTLDFDMRTNRQLRTGSAPNTWETAWILWRFTDEAPKSNHHYYFTLKTNGWEFGKKDNPPGDDTLEQQIFIATGTTPKVTLGVFQHITIVAKDFSFTIKVNGTVVYTGVDPLVNDVEKMSTGLIGLYSEDSDVSFDNVNLVTQ